MNERIRELAEQAGFVMWQNEPWNPGDVVDWSVRYDDELKKFAELIVRECADVACKHMELNEGTDYNLGGKIKKHFGVEE